MAAWQAWLVMGVAVAVAAGLFLLKLRPPQVVVASLTIWRRVLDETRDRTLWERIRRAVSLLVALLITLALALAILRPQPAAPAAETPSGRVAIVIDSSWSMLARTSSGETRWDRAVARARALAVGAGGEDVVLSTTADGVVEGPTPDVALLEAALDRISPSGGAATSWPRVEGARTTYFLTDGALARPLRSDVMVESVFEPAANVAITAFDVRPGPTLDQAGQAFLEVANYATTSQDVRITLTRGRASVLDVHVDLAAGAAMQRIVSLDRGGDPRLRAHISARDNALVVDDEAVAWIPGARPIVVTVVSDQPAAFGPFLSRDPDVKATFVSPRAYKPGSEELLIFDGVVPAAPPTVPALFIAPPAASWLGTPGTDEHAPQWVAGAAHPLVAGVDIQTMTIERARPYAGSGLVPIASSAARTPLVYVSEAPDQRFVLFTFSVSESKLMFTPGFPVLLGNTIDWLAHPVPAGTRRPGPATFEGSLSSIVGPNGREVSIAKVGGASVATLRSVGFYDMTAGGATSVVAVNVGDPETSDLRRTRLPEAARANATGALTRGRPWWLFAAVAALILLAAEWWTWQRRITV